jgi:hypothetical protein
MPGKAPCSDANWVHWSLNDAIQARLLDLQRVFFHVLDYCFDTLFLFLFVCFC